MRKLFQINECLNYSTGWITQSIGELAIKNGWESWIAYSKREPYIKSKSHIVGVGNFIDGCLHYAGYRLFDGEGLYSKNHTRGLIDKIDMIAPDIIQLHNIHDHWLNYPLLFDYLSSLDIPIIWVQHDCWSITGGCMYFDMHGCDNWKTGCKCCPDKRSLLINQSERNFNLMSSHLSKIKTLVYVPVSYWLSDIIKQSSQKDRQIVTIHNGVDIDVFKEKKDCRLSNKINLLGVAGVWAPRKGLNDFFRLREMLPMNDFDITLVGLTNKQISHLPNGIKGLGKTNSQEELARIYSEADIYLNPTYSDNFPTTNIEALACGTPVITYNTGGSPEAVDEQTGIVVPQGNIQALVDAIYQLVEQPFSTNNCRKRAETLFDKKKCYKKYFDLYNQLLK